MDNRSDRKKKIALAVAMIVLMLAGSLANRFSVVQRDQFIEKHGALLEHKRIGEFTREDGSIITSLHVSSDTGLEVRLRLLLPAGTADKSVPSLLLIGGHRTGKDAVELIESPNGIAYAAIDYPYAGRQRPSDVWQIVGAVPAIQTAFLDTPPALMLAMDWLSQQPWFDPDRAELVGVSLGVPFAAVAGALDTRFSRVWLIHGAVDNHEWVMHAARDRIQNRILRSIAVRSALFIAYGNSFRTVDWLREIAPRPVVVVLARDDDRMPMQSAEDYVADSGTDHVTIVWTEGQHVGPDRGNELQQIIDIVQGEIERSTDVD